MVTEVILTLFCSAGKESFANNEPIRIYSLLFLGLILIDGAHFQQWTCPNLRTLRVGV